jgi:hypothetical protein
MSKKFICDFCNKNISTKGNLERHVKICKEKFELKKNIKKNKSKEIIKENEELKIKIITLETEIKLLKEYKQEIKTDKEEQFKTISDIAKQPKNNNNNNNILNYKNKLSVPFDLGDSDTIKQIQTKLCDTIEYKHLLDGQKSVAKFVHTYILVNDEGKNEKYVCSDPSRGTFRFKDKDGTVVLDIKAVKLSKIVYKTIRDRVLQIKYDFNRDSNDAFDINYLNKNIDLIMELMNDNTEFRHEMINLSNYRGII